MCSFPLEVPEQVSFKQAIALTQSLLSCIEAGEVSELEIAAFIDNLVKTENGARGFFVTYLTSDTALADHPSKSIVEGLQSNPDTVAELLVKNLAMSAAQTLHHRRHQDEKMAQSSEQVQQRTTYLIKLVDLPAVRDRSQKLLESASTGEGIYKDFLERWGYDAEQRQTMCEALQQVISK